MTERQNELTREKPTTSAMRALAPYYMGELEAVENKVTEPVSGAEIKTESEHDLLIRHLAEGSQIFDAEMVLSMPLRAINQFHSFRRDIKGAAELIAEGCLSHIVGVVMPMGSGKTTFSKRAPKELLVFDVDKIEADYVSSEKKGFLKKIKGDAVATGSWFLYNLFYFTQITFGLVDKMKEHEIKLEELPGHEYPGDREMKKSGWVLLAHSKDIFSFLGIRYVLGGKVSWKETKRVILDRDGESSVEIAKLNWDGCNVKEFRNHKQLHDSLYLTIAILVNSLE